ncbi:MAG TPA: O-antigen ligase family protein [Lacipirellulaceae bacterium]
MLRLNPSLVSTNGHSGTMVVDIPRQVAGVSRFTAVGITAWCVGAFLAAAVIGLNHDPNYATARALEQVEEGRDVEEKAVMEDGLGVAAAGRVVGFALLLGVGAFCIATLPNDVRFRWDRLSILIAMGLAWAMASVAWSVEPDTTARELVRLLAYGGVAAALALRFDLRTLCFVLAAALAGSVATAVAYEIGTGGFKPWHADYRLTGSMHSNILAIQAAIVALVAYAFALQPGQRRAFCWALFTAALAVVVLTKARTALFTVIAGVVAIHVVGRPARQWLFYAACVMSFAAIALLTASALGISDEHGLQNVANLGRSDDVGDLTGRLPLWNFIWHESEGHRLQGFGWGAFWLTERVKDAREALHWFPRHSHNAYLQVMVNLGLVELAIVVAIGLIALRRAASLVRRTGLPEASALVAILIAIFVNGTAESAFVMPRDMGLFSAAAVLSLLVVRRGTESQDRVSDFERERMAESRTLVLFPPKVSLS